MTRASGHDPSRVPSGVRVQSIAVVALVTLILVGGCGRDDGNSIVRADPSPEVIVYGRGACSITTATRTALDAEGISFVYKDVDVAENGHEMWEKVKATSWYEGGSVGLPVVDVKGIVMERPSIEEIKSALGDTPSK